MSLITPDFGLFFWMLLTFGIVAFILGRFAWKPIMKGIKAREHTIADALDKARQAQEEIASLEAKNAKMLAEAQAERNRMMEEAKALRQRIVEEAKEEARQQAQQFIENARQTMRQEELEMRRNFRQEVIDFALQATERVLREKLADKSAQQKHVDQLLEEMHY